MMTQTELDTLAPKMDRAARELAHGEGHETPDAFAAGYVLAVAETCGAASSSQCADGEEWDPSEWLDGDAKAVREACELVGLDIAELPAGAWRRYVSPSASAYDCAGLARR